MLFWLSAASVALAVMIDEIAVEEGDLESCDTSTWIKCASVIASCAATCHDNGVSSQVCISCMGDSYETCKECLGERPAELELSLQGDLGGVAATVRDNKVYFHGASAVGFVMTGHSITGGQPWDGVHDVPPDGLNFRAGRKGSSGPATYFKQGLSPVQMMGLSTMIGVSPAKLNFAMIGHLTIEIGGKKITCENMHLGQGHVTTKNNWWIGGSTCAGASKAHMLKCECGLAFYNGDDDHTFNVATSAEVEVVESVITTGGVAATVRDNEVFFRGASAVGFVMKGHSITSGQPWDGVHDVPPDGLNFRAGRHGSSGPATYFKQGLSPVQMMGLSTTIGLSPAKLNFAMIGDLTIEIGGRKITCENMHLGQGHVDTLNNWWIGGSTCAGASKAHMLKCECGLAFYNGDDDHTFNVATSAEVNVVESVITTGVAATEHDNKVYFHGASAVGFVMTGHSITSGQPWGGVHDVPPDGLNFRAGRKGSSGPAQYFKQGLSPLQMMGLSTMIDQAPAKMNFAMIGHLTIEIGGKRITCQNMHLGQGHVSTKNNWWIGGSTCAGGTMANMLKCKCGLAFYPGDNDHTFNVGTSAEVDVVESGRTHVGVLRGFALTA